MNNAGVGNNPGKPWENLEAWKTLIDVNFWGVVHGVQAFGARMLAQGTPALIVNTGSKQGITTPPGNLAYNVSKAALKNYTEGLAHALRNVPGAHHRAPADSRLHLYRPDRRVRPKSRPALGPASRSSTSCWSAGARRFLHPVPGQRDRPRHGRTPHGLGHRRHHREPPRPVALASGLWRAFAEFLKSWVRRRRPALEESLDRQRLHVGNGVGQPRDRPVPPGERFDPRRDISGANRSRSARAGTPATISYGSTSLVTTAFAPMTAPLPIDTPGMITAPWPIQTSWPIVTRLPAAAPKPASTPR